MKIEIEKQNSYYQLYFQIYSKFISGITWSEWFQIQINENLQESLILFECQIKSLKVIEIYSFS